MRAIVHFASGQLSSSENTDIAYLNLALFLF